MPVPVDCPRAHEQDARVACAGRVENVARAFDVHQLGPLRLSLGARDKRDRGQMSDAVRTAFPNRGKHILETANIDTVVDVPVARQPDYLVSPLPEVSAQVSADESGGTRDQ